VTGTTIAASDLTLSYHRTVALAGVSFTLSRGVTGLLGPNGAGKTTLLRILATAATPDSGSLRVLGRDPASARDRLEIRRRLGYLPQEPGFHPSFTAFEFVDYVAILKEMVDRRGRHGEVRRVLAEVGLSDQRGKRIKALSGGMRQRLALAAALVGDPELLILDEPTVGLDPEQRLRLRELTANLGEERTVLLSTHQTEDVMSLCQRVIVLVNGGIRFEGEPPGLAALADGRVWTSDTKAPGALAAWRTGTGRYRNIGDPPPGAELLEPTLEDGYLMLVGVADQAPVAA
jgi:ABC-2 type transport system ATP-binding protein